MPLLLENGTTRGRAGDVLGRREEVGKRARVPE